MMQPCEAYHEPCSGCWRRVTALIRAIGDAICGRPADFASCRPASRALNEELRASHARCLCTASGVDFMKAGSVPDFPSIRQIIVEHENPSQPDRDCGQ